MFCLETGNDWDEGFPFLNAGDSTGFSSAQLVFGHTGPLKQIKDKLFGEGPVRLNVLDYVAELRERLHCVCEAAKQSRVSSQTKMKVRYEKDVVNSNPHDQVLILSPLVGSSLQARFVGPYVVKKRLGDTNYVVSTPDRKRKHRITC